GGSAFIVINHPALGVELALIDIVTAHECEVDCARIAWQRRGDRAAIPAPVAVRVRKPVPVTLCRPEPADQNARSPVRGARDRCLRVPNDLAEGLILGYLDGQELACTVGERTPGPKDDAMRIGIA